MFDLKKHSDIHVMCLLGRLKYSKLERLIESHKNKTQPPQSKLRSRTKESIKRVKRELKRNRHRGVHGHYLFFTPPHTPAVSNQQSKKKAGLFKKHINNYFKIDLGKKVEPTTRIAKIGPLCSHSPSLSQHLEKITIFQHD